MQKITSDTLAIRAHKVALEFHHLRREYRRRLRYAPKHSVAMRDMEEELYRLKKETSMLTTAYFKAEGIAPGLRGFPK